MVENSAGIPTTIAHLAAGEVELSQVLAELFSLIVAIRLQMTAHRLIPDTAQMLLDEYEALTEKLDAGSRLSPFVTSEDFLIQPVADRIDHVRPTIASELARNSVLRSEIIKDKDKGHSSNVVRITKEQANRSSIILEVVRGATGISIKDISAVVKQCGEKTIQRELNELIRQGLIRRVGERRWSLYEPI